MALAEFSNERPGYLRALRIISASVRTRNPVWTVFAIAGLASLTCLLSAVGCTKRSVQGESCTRSDDCDGHLRCVNSVCKTPDETGSPSGSSLLASSPNLAPQVAGAGTAGQHARIEAPEAATGPKNGFKPIPTTKTTPGLVNNPVPAAVAGAADWQLQTRETGNTYELAVRDRAGTDQQVVEVVHLRPDGKRSKIELKLLGTAWASVNYPRDFPGKHGASADMPDMLYGGRHRWFVQVNGRQVKSSGFTVNNMPE